MNVKLSNRNVSAVLIVILSLTLVLSFGCAKEPEWKSLNDEVVQEQNVTMRARDDIPRTKVVPSLAPGETNTKDALTAVELYPGVKAKMYWGKGALVSWATMEPGAKIPEEELTEERIMVVWSGSVEQLIDGKYVPMKQYNKVTNWTNTPQKDFIYLREGAMNGVIAGNKGAEILEIYAPVRADYVEKAGGKMPSKRIVGNYDIVPSCVPNKVLNFYDVQYTNLSDMTANSRIISGRRVQCSFLDVDPGRISPYHNHPEEQLMIVLRGQIDETVMDKTVTMNPGDICYLPGDMVHRGEYSSLGCDILDVFWPPRSDYNEKMNDRLAKYHAIIPQSAKPVLEHDGEVSEPFLNFTEGPSWLNGSLYFSNMWFASDWSAGNPQKSNLIRMGGDGLEI
ncbi:MAG: cupin domain-containing protein, partial [Candidatus Latescibacteria bacterium]|nr:cupin domain-containing protein [Candidatus Latescibacterota bacterium]